ncbi:8-amino-7-oxononanoate synthase [Chiayiivirga flava]|uniref:8-amino-7-oxononanoate synthase n=1 Tax=Chiayiivirga flava TaxID=659595 RepID=A0A7W8G0E3_9GAMM|nr:8-amino-7-oxononanoate synthase [Chiayiivirga flava]
MDGADRSARPSWSDRLRRDALAREATAMRRHVRQVQQRDGVFVHVDGRRLVNFSSNDYLGLAQHLDLTAALQECAAYSGVGSTASHLVCGHHREHVRLEELAAEWQKYPRALLFGSGYLANLGVLQALLRDGDLCVQDKLNHACLLDGARFSGADLKRYPHLDLDAAQRQLRTRPDATALIASDGVFSMDGDLAPLPLLALLARSEDALLYIDDAHGVGVIGPYGRGSVAQAGLGVRDVPLQMITLGKALGGYGALVLGTEELIEAIAQRARPYLFTTALPPALAAASCAAIELVRGESWRRLKLSALVKRFRRGAAQLGLPLLDSGTPIQPIVLGENQAALDASIALERAGFLVAAIRPPTVAPGSARLRVTLSAAHEETQIDALLDALEKCCKPRNTAAAG